MAIDRRFILGALGAALLTMPGVLSTGVLAQSKDLNAEIVQPGKPKPPKPATPVIVSLSPIGPSILPVGTPIRFRVSSNLSGYGHLYVTNASGKVVMLAENLPLKAKRAVDLPQAGLILRAAPPTGDNTVLFLATRDRFAGFAGGATTTTPADIQVTGQGLLASLKNRLAGAARHRWGFTDVVIRVVD